MESDDGVLHRQLEVVKRVADVDVLHVVKPHAHFIGYAGQLRVCADQLLLCLYLCLHQSDPILNDVTWRWKSLCNSRKTLQPQKRIFNQQKLIYWKHYIYDICWFYLCEVDFVFVCVWTWVWKAKSDCSLDSILSCEMSQNKQQGLNHTLCEQLVPFITLNRWINVRKKHRNNQFKEILEIKKLPAADVTKYCVWSNGGRFIVSSCIKTVQLYIWLCSEQLLLCIIAAPYSFFFYTSYCCLL